MSSSFMRAVALATGALFWAGAAEAVPTYTFTECGLLSPDVTGAVDNTNACEVVRRFDGSSNPINDDESVVNNAPLGDAFLGMFDAENWAEIARDNFGTDENDLPNKDIDFIEDAAGTGSSATLAGSYDLSIIDIGFAIDIWDDYDEVAMVFKTGCNSQPSCLVAYRLVPSTLTGTYVTPFCCDSGTADPKEISHVTLYGRNAVVPVPAAAPLLLTAAAGLVALRRRRRG